MGQRSFVCMLSSLWSSVFHTLWSSVFHCVFFLQFAWCVDRAKGQDASIRRGQSQMTKVCSSVAKVTPLLLLSIFLFIFSYDLMRALLLGVCAVWYHPVGRARDKLLRSGEDAHHLLLRWSLSLHIYIYISCYDDSQPRPAFKLCIQKKHSIVKYGVVD